MSDLSTGKRWLVAVLFAFALAFAACGPDDDNGDNGPVERALTGVVPSTGELAGGTGVEVRGEGFEDGLMVFFGARWKAHGRRG